MKFHSPHRSGAAAPPPRHLATSPSRRKRSELPHFVLFVSFVVMILLISAAADPTPIEKPNQIWILLAPLIATIITSYGVRLFRWLGIPIEDHLLYPILVKLIELIARVESTGDNGTDKKRSVVAMALQSLKPSEIKLLTRRFGNIETAVQAAFEMSSTAKKGTK